MPLTFVLWTCMSLARGAADALSPMWALAVACALGATATPILVVGAFGAPRLGVLGAAVSTILAQAAALAFLLARWKRSGHPLAPGSAWRSCAPELRIAATMLRIGLPAAMQMLTMALAEMVLLGLVNRHGSGVTAAYGAATQLLSWVQFPAMSLGIAASILSAQAMGAGRAARLPAILASGLRLNALVTTAFVAVAHLAAPVALRLFVTDDAVLGVAVGLFRTVAWSVVLFGWSNVLVGTMRASGTVLLPTALGMLAIVAAELPAAVLLEARFGLQGLWWSWPIGFALMLLLQAVYCGRVWRHAPVLRPV
jgi:Na+-driven multidrug efflux pump